MFVDHFPCQVLPFFSHKIISLVADSWQLGVPNHRQVHYLLICIAHNLVDDNNNKMHPIPANNGSFREAYDGAQCAI